MKDIIDELLMESTDERSNVQRILLIAVCYFFGVAIIGFASQYLPTYLIDYEDSKIELAGILSFIFTLIFPVFIFKKITPTLSAKSLSSVLMIVFASVFFGDLVYRNLRYFILKLYSVSGIEVIGNLFSRLYTPMFIAVMVSMFAYSHYNKLNKKVE